MSISDPIKDPSTGAKTTSSPAPPTSASHPGFTTSATKNVSQPPPMDQQNHDNDQSPQHDSTSQRFSAEEESTLLAESNTIKQSANQTFSSGDFSSAITHYDRALASCPSYLDYEVAVLKSNIAACHLKLEDWKAAIDAATAALDALERLLPSPPKPKSKDDSRPQDGGDAKEEEGEENGLVELEGDDAAVSAALEALNLSDQRKSDILRIRSKSLLRRARARSQLTTWSELQGAEDDYRTLSLMPELPKADRRVVDTALRELPLRVKMAREKEVGEMMGKLKELGNGILKPFGLSTDMFKVQQQEGGGYSLSVDSGGEK